MARKNDAFYFEAFCASADYSYQAAQLLSKIMHNFDPDRLEEAIDEMHAIEQAADERRHEVLDALVTAFVTPIEREDIAELSEYLDTVTDRIEGVLHRLYFNNIREMRPDALELVDIVVRSCELMRSLVGELSQFKKSKKLRQYVVELNTIEQEADDCYMRSMRNLHTTCTDPIVVFTWHETYSFLEYCVDYCEQVADTIDTIAMKNS